MSEVLGVLTDMEKDVIGEVMNISMGSGATAMSTVLDTKVNITTPRIEVVPITEFDFSHLEPVIGVSIKYVEGIDGVNVLLLKEEDLKKIVPLMLIYLTIMYILHLQIKLKVQMAIFYLRKSKRLFIIEM